MRFDQLIGALVVGIGLSVAWADPPLPPAGYRWEPDPRFSDEFDGCSLDTTKWYDHFPTWRGRPPAKFLPSSVSVSDGCLVLRASRLPAPDGPFTIAGGAVVSRSSEALYGYYEARMKASRISMSSTFWLNNSGHRVGSERHSQELDIVETVGGPQPEPEWAREWNWFMHSNTHYNVRHRDGRREHVSKGGKARLDTPAGEAFHTYGAWWVDANTIHFYLDGKYVFTVHPSTKFSPTPFDQPMHVNMVMETYDWQPAPSPEDLADPARNATYYDWVRAWRLVKVAPEN
ncbi:MAG: glycosyl hydrolase family protein [Verrucomicrobia bacterium]|nr:MAG: glycosyl hydrolase family protein [Verrucomicrobiota bacterium]